LRQEVVGCLGALEHWIIEETGWPKQGQESVGVQHQYCGAVGKQANCQISVQLMLSDGWMCVPVAGRLYLPQSWSADPTALDPHLPWPPSTGPGHCERVVGAVAAASYAAPVWGGTRSG
jgi:DDE superfamily endonuclease